MRLLAIDPGTTAGHKLGWARFADSMLIDAGETKDWLLIPIAGAELIVFEYPEFYDRGPANPNKLAKLIRQIGQIEGFAIAHGCSAFKHYLPKEWKGQLPKDICHARARASLTGGEPVPAIGLDGWDAIALGLKHLGRIKRWQT